MDFAIHYQILLAIFCLAATLGAVVGKTHFCTLGAVSDWVNLGDLRRLRAWLLACAIAIAGLGLLETAQLVQIPADSFPSYRSPNLAWPRHLLGGLMFGAGMVFASGCINKMLVRLGGGNLKSLMVLVIAAGCAYLMMWTGFYASAFERWLAPLNLHLHRYGIETQTLDAIISGLLGCEATPLWHLATVFVCALLLLLWILRCAEFRADRDNLLGGATVGLAVLAGWWLTAGSLGQRWLDWAQMADPLPSRVAVQSLTFVSPLGDLLRYLMASGNPALINFGIVALCGVLAGAWLQAVATRRFRFEWFISFGDFVAHAVGAVLMGIGGVLAMGCTIGQGVTGVSTLALGSFLTFGAIVAGAALALKYQYWRILRADSSA